MAQVRLLVVGFGNVGRALARALREKRALYGRQGLDFSVVGVVDIWGALVDPGGLNLARALERKGRIRRMSGVEAARTLDYDILVETTVTNVKDGQPGLGHMEAALRRGRFVVTSNKGPLALRYRPLMELAGQKGVELRFEATVGGAMPIIALARETLAGNSISSIRGVFNGTTNYILTRMAEDGLSYAEVLAEAQELGIAEADPTYDVEGIDAASKLVILANAVFGRDVKYASVRRTGITQITPEALQLAHRQGYTIRLIGEVGPRGPLTVAPRLVRLGSPLAVEGTLNAASLLCDLAGEITVTGKGAGPREAAASLVSDIFAIVRGHPQRFK